MRGFFKFPRNVLSLDCFTDPLCVKAYIVLMSEARFQPAVIDGVRVEAGQLLRSTAYLAERFGTSRRTAQYILDKFRSINGIKTVNIRNQTLLITLLPLFLTGENTGEEPAKEQESAYYEASAPCGASSENTYPSSENCSAQGEKLPFSEENEDTPRCNNEAFSAKPTPEPSDEVQILGKFRNVRMTLSQLSELKKTVPPWSFYIERLSAYIANNPYKNYENHYAVIYSWYLKDSQCKENLPVNGGNIAPFSGMNRPKQPESQGFFSSGASYDIKRAELRALTSVPVLKKRDPVTGEWKKPSPEKTKTSGIPPPDSICTEMKNVVE